MIDAAALRRQATNKYPDVVEAILRGEDPFPLQLRYPRIRTTDSREAILRDIGVLKAESREQLAYGLTIEWAEVNTAKHGRNPIPDGISLATEDDFLGYIGKQDEMRAVRGAAEIIAQAFPEIRPQLPGMWRLLRDGTRDFWHGIVRVVSFFRDAPFPERYIRELPIEVPTKFVWENRALIERLIGEIAPQSLRPERETFEERLGLKTPDALIECRILDDTLLLGWHFRQFTVGIKDVDYLGELSARTVLITENRTNFLTLPTLRSAIAIQGQGYAVSRLGRVPFLKSKRILYWGDLDAQGFEILATLRRALPQVESLMMDAETWERFKSFRGDGVASRNPPQQFLPYLSEPESALFTEIAAVVGRLEQERIPQSYANQRIARAMAAD